MMRPVQVVIGRGQGENPPLGAAAWGRFRGRIVTMLHQKGEFYQLVPGLGVDINGRPEENATILGSFPEEDLDQLRNLLTELQIQFGQYAILLIVGDLEVIA